MGVFEGVCSLNGVARSRWLVASLILVVVGLSGCSFDDTGQQPQWEGDASDIGADAPGDIGGRDASDVGDAGEPGDGGDAGEPGDGGDVSDGEDTDASEADLCTETCTSDDDCAGTAACVVLPDGNFCARDCGSSDCPEGFSCESIISVDGTTSDQCVPATGVCAECFDEDSDGYGIGEMCSGEDCNDADGRVYPDADELCDGIDNNCDGVVDEGCECVSGDTQPCYSGRGGTEGVGQCQEGTQTCTDGAWGTCDGEVTPEAGEACVDGIDNNCDGAVDEGCSCDFGGTSQGVCAASQIDDSGACAEPAGYEADEQSCDGLDNDCDGAVDENCSCTSGDSQACYTGPAGTAGVGACQQGSQMCTGGSWGACSGEVTPEAETCDGVDNNCDGTTDEGCCSGVGTTSAVTATSGCLVSGTSAESAIVVDLVDAAGSPLSGANVTMTTSAGTLSAVNSSGSTYWAILEAPASSGVSSATVSVSVEDSCGGQPVQLDTQVSVVFAEPFSDANGGAGGCAADGNVRVQVVRAEDGSPIANANVMIGGAENTSAFVTSYDTAPSAANTGTTDANGYIEFKDFASSLDAPLTVTAGATGRAYMTMVGIDAADLILPLEQVDPLEYTRTFDGDFTNINTADDLDVGFMLADVSIDQILDFNLDTLLADNVCYQSGNGWVGDINLPDNVFIPNQNLGLLVGSVNKKSYGSAPVDYGDRYLTGIAGESALTDASSGDIIQMLQGLDFQKIGSRNEMVDATSTTSGVDLNMTNTLTGNVDCAISNEPTDADIFCLMAGDWDSRNDASLNVGAGRLFLMGFGIADASQQTGAFTINDVSTVGRSGIFSDVQYMGASVAAYLDASKTPPAGTENGVSIIARRDPTLVGASGGTLTFDDYIPIRVLTQSGRQFDAAALASGSFPAPHFTRTTIRQAITETYSACGNNDSERTFYNTLWTVYTDGATNSYTLPTLPSAWPRAANGGFIDPATTPENDTLNWLHMTLYEGLNTSFDYDAISFGSLRDNVTHASINDADF